MSEQARAVLNHGRVKLNGVTTRYSHLQHIQVRCLVRASFLVLARTRVWAVILFSPGPFWCLSGDGGCRPPFCRRVLVVCPWVSIAYASRLVIFVSSPG